MVSMLKLNFFSKVTMQFKVKIQMNEKVMTGCGLCVPSFLVWVIWSWQLLQQLDKLEIIHTH